MKCFPLQWWEKRASIAQIAKNWVISYAGNLIGSLFVIKLLALTGLAVAGPAAMKIAAAKTSLTFTEVRFKIKDIGPNGKHIRVLVFACYREWLSRGLA